MKPTMIDAGSDLQGIRTNAKKDGDDWIINGSKTYITNGWLSDVCVVVAKTKADAKRAAHGVSLFLVDTNTPGFHKGRIRFERFIYLQKCDTYHLACSPLKKEYFLKKYIINKDIIIAV